MEQIQSCGLAFFYLQSRQHRQWQRCFLATTLLSSQLSGLQPNRLQNKSRDCFGLIWSVRDGGEPSSPVIHKCLRPMVQCPFAVSSLQRGISAVFFFFCGLQKTRRESSISRSSLGEESSRVEFSSGSAIKARREEDERRHFIMGKLRQS